MHDPTPQSPSHRLAWLLGLCAGAAVGLAHAAPTDSGRWTPGPDAGTHSPDTQVKAVCPQLEAQLSEALGLAQARHRDEGTTLVSFRLNGRVIDEIRQRGGPTVYRSELRRAVRRLSCDNGGIDRTYVMQVTFVDSPTNADTTTQAAAASPPTMRVSAVDIIAAQRLVGNPE